MFALSEAAIDPSLLKQDLLDSGCGACVTFEGWVRNHNEGREVVALEYEAYEALALPEGQRILEEVKAQFGVAHARCVHRTGRLALGDVAVWVGVSAGHRGEAFEACRRIIDEIKHRAPIWKKEYYVDGMTGWVNCEACAAASDQNHRHG